MDSALIVNSGGARGADSKWYEYFMKSEKSVEFHVKSFKNMSIYHSKKCAVDMITEEERTKAKSTAKKAAENMGLKCAPRTEYILRDYIQVEKADAVFAVTTLDSTRKGVGVAGGTGFTCQMYIDLHNNSHNLFLYNTDVKSWMKWSDNTWIELDNPPDPFDYKTVACIGSRKFNDEIVDILS